MFSHCKCIQCGKTCNGKTGKSNTVPITIYICVTSLIGLAVLVAFIAYQIANG